MHYPIHSHFTTHYHFFFHVFPLSTTPTTTPNSAATLIAPAVITKTPTPDPLASETPRVVDKFNSANTSGGYGQDSCSSTNTDSSYNSGSKNNTDSSIGASAAQDRRLWYEKRRVQQRRVYGPRGQGPDGRQGQGGAEKLAGKMMGNTGLQECGQECKMGKFENEDF
ncbi:hypothetical protein B0H17DRAFT_1134365 [Mycena rosella]|uniref:Uncharacterized protein n=1 Tax=Mycena rosella TaxID=1033263 RepID=A0AAD7GJ22_MYCRO|nr:hypothetical protein B0H17DRAFT_1134365 [Mycena rosella]